MIPTPDYLKPYAFSQQQDGNRLSFKVKCSCGCNTFSVLEGSNTDDEKRMIQEYEDNLSKTKWHSIHGGVDSRGKTYHYIKRFGFFKKNIDLPAPPVFSDINSPWTPPIFQNVISYEIILAHVHNQTHNASKILWQSA